MSTTQPACVDSLVEPMSTLEVDERGPSTPIALDAFDDDDDEEWGPSTPIDLDALDDDEDEYLNDLTIQRFRNMSASFTRVRWQSTVFLSYAYNLDNRRNTTDSLTFVFLVKTSPLNGSQQKTTQSQSSSSTAFPYHLKRCLEL